VIIICIQIGLAFCTREEDANTTSAGVASAAIIFLTVGWGLVIIYLLKITLPESEQEGDANPSFCKRISALFITNKGQERLLGEGSELITDDDLPIQYQNQSHSLPIPKPHDLAIKQARLSLRD
jgi:hypothetical protein